MGQDPRDHSSHGRSDAFGPGEPGSTPSPTLDEAAQAAADAERPREGSGRSRVLHARISEELHEALSRAAAELRVPVSNLVRNALEDTFTLVDNMSVNVRHFVGRAMKEAGEVGAQLRQRRAGHPGSESDPAAAGRPVRSAPDAAPPQPDKFAHVIAWQPAILHSAQQCSDCGTQLAPGARIYSGLTSAGSAPVWLCRACVWRHR